MLATNKQKGLIKGFQNSLGIDDGTYREMLFYQFKVESSKQLTEKQAKQFISELKVKAIAAGVYKGGGAASKLRNKGKYQNLANRENFATDAQLRLISYLWSTVSRMETEKERDEALNSFLHRIIGVEAIRFVLKKDVNKVVAAIRNMEKIR